MIIGINGKIGVGKDAVGKIIQYLQCHNTGQITIEDVVSNPEHEWWLEEQSKFEIKKFAGKLKQIASILTGVPVEKFEDQEFKKKYMPEEWSVEIWNDPDPIEDNDYRITSRIKYEGDTSLITYNDGLSEAEVFDHEIEKRLVTYREFLQKLGTEAMRDGLHTNVWVNALFADYKGQKNTDSSFSHPNWIITDMRFPNEMEAVELREGLTIRVTRNNATRVIDTNPHPSETALDNAKFDYEIINDGTIEDLVEKVREILTKEKII